MPVKSFEVKDDAYFITYHNYGAEWDEWLALSASNLLELWRTYQDSNPVFGLEGRSDIQTTLYVQPFGWADHT